MTTLYYRFKGAPADRPGGPWWHQEFESNGQLATYLQDIKPFLEEHITEPNHSCTGRYCHIHYPGGYLEQRFWRTGCNYESDSICNKCGDIHNQTYKEAHGAEIPKAQSEGPPGL